MSFTTIYLYKEWSMQQDEKHEVEMLDYVAIY